MVVLEGDKKHRSTVVFGEVNFGGGVLVQAREGGFPEHGDGAGNVVTVANLVRLFLAQRVREGVVELLGVERDGRGAFERVAQRGQLRAHLGRARENARPTTEEQTAVVPPSRPARHLGPLHGGRRCCGLPLP